MRRVLYQCIALRNSKRKDFGHIEGHRELIDFLGTWEKNREAFSHPEKK
jgi:hypothetical protein